MDATGALTSPATSSGDPARPFKANTDDLRDSPAWVSAALLRLAGAALVVYDPGVDASPAVLAETVRAIAAGRVWMSDEKRAEWLAEYRATSESVQADLDLLEQLSPRDG